MSVVLLVGAGLFVRSLGELKSLDLGVDVDHLLLAQLELVRSDLDDAEQAALYQEAGRVTQRVPGVASTAAVNVPFQWASATNLRVPGLDSLPRLPGGGPYYFPVTPSYFETVGVGIVRGRGIEASDVEGGERVAVVSQTMARSIWPDADALGQCLLFGRDAVECTLVVGVAEDAARGGYQDAPFMAYYLPLTQVTMPARALYVRVDGDAEHFVAEVATALRGFSPEVRFVDVRDVRAMLEPQARAWTLGAMMFSVFGLLALTLAAIGLYSVLAFDVAQRTRELGIRTALGAERARLLRGVVGHGTRLAVTGVLTGLAVAYAAAPYAAELLFEVSPRDPAVIVAVAATLLLVGVVASLVPGFRATRVDPMVALQTE
jgi:predicted permease